MEITQHGELRSITVGTINLPVRPMILDIIEDVKKLDPSDHELIIKDAGVDVPPGMENLDLLYLAMSLVQNIWYVAVAPGADVQESVQKEYAERVKRVHDGHEARLEKFAKAAEKARKNPPTAAAASKEPKAPKAPKAPKEPKAAKPAAPSTARVSGRLYTINPDADVAIIATFTGFRKSIYDAVKNAGPEARLSAEKVLELTIAGGTTFKGADGGKNQTNYQLGELTKMRAILLLAAEVAAPVAEPVAA